MPYLKRSRQKYGGCEDGQGAGSFEASVHRKRSRDHVTLLSTVGATTVLQLYVLVAATTVRTAMYFLCLVPTAERGVF